jgi:hypothetical protein
MCAGLRRLTGSFFQSPDSDLLFACPLLLVLGSNRVLVCTYSGTQPTFFKNYFKKVFTFLKSSSIMKHMSDSGATAERKRSDSDAT